MKQSDKAGLPPGTLVFLGNVKSEKTRVTVIDYDKEHHKEQILENVADSKNYRHTDSVTWINVDGLHDADLIASIGESFGLHGLLLEDILNTRHRPKVQEFKEHIFITLKMLSISSNDELVSEQVSLVLGDGWVLSFQEQVGDVFESLRERLLSNRGIIRSKRADYLFYRLLDTVVDHYFIVSDFVNQANEELEEYVLESSKQENLVTIQTLRRQLLGLRRSISPLKEAISTLIKDKSELIEEETQMYFRDVFDHIIQVNDSLDIQRELLTAIMDLHNTSISNAMNKVMQTLTITATIFIPLTFIAGVYGMNFKNMPELAWDYGYFGALGLMLAMGLVMLLFFKRKNWF